MANPRHTLIIRVLFIMLWTGLATLAAVGVFFACLVVAGAVQSAVLDCGPRSNWSEVNYLDCSDIDETQPIFFGIALTNLTPMALALLALRIRRRPSPNARPLFAQGSVAVIRAIVVAVSTLGGAWFIWLWVQDFRLARSLCPSQTIPDPCPMRWMGTYVVAAIAVVFLIAPCVYLLKRLRRLGRHQAVTPPR